ncbi:hypothetical protein PORY_002851, partial [Pneumocystis oryctolagi]
QKQQVQNIVISGGKSVEFGKNHREVVSWLLNDNELEKIQERQNQKDKSNTLQKGGPKKNTRNQTSQLSNSFNSIHDISNNQTLGIDDLYDQNEENFDSIKLSSIRPIFKKSELIYIFVFPNCCLISSNSEFDTKHIKATAELDEIRQHYQQKQQVQNIVISGGKSVEFGKNHREVVSWLLNDNELEKIQERQYFILTIEKSTLFHLISDLNKLKDDLKLFCSHDVLENAKAVMLSQNKKSTFEDINLDSEIINLRFDEGDAVIKSFSDAIDELYYENSKKSQDTIEKLDLDSVNKSLKIWYDLAPSRSKNEIKHPLKNPPREPKNMEQKRNMSRNQRSRYRDKKHSQFNENSQLNHYGDSRKSRGRQEARKKFRNMPMNHNYRAKGGLPIEKKPNESSFNNASNFVPGYIHHNFQHSTLPYNNYIPQNYTDYNHIQQPTNMPSYPMQYNNTYYSYVTPQNIQYGTPLINNQYQKLHNYSETEHSSTKQFQNSQENISFTSEQQGRHKHLPLPSDFMLGPIDGVRIEMPEPHHVLGVIKGMVIRDGQGNFGIRFIILNFF